MSRLRRDEGGQVIVLSAVMIPVFLLIAALVLDVGNWYTHKRQLQNRADAAAFAAGTAYAKNWKACVQTGDATLKANTAQEIADAAREYGGDPEASDYSTGSLPASLYNTEIANQNKLNLNINSTSYDNTDAGGVTTVVMMAYCFIPPFAISVANDIRRLGLGVWQPLVPWVTTLLDAVYHSSVFVRLMTVLSTGFSGSPWCLQVVSNVGAGVACFGLAWWLFPIANRDPDQIPPRRWLSISKSVSGNKRLRTAGRPWSEVALVVLLRSLAPGDEVPRRQRQAAPEDEHREDHHEDRTRAHVRTSSAGSSSSSGGLSEVSGRHRTRSARRAKTTTAAAAPHPKTASIHPG